MPPPLCLCRATSLLHTSLPTSLGGFLFYFIPLSMVAASPVPGGATPSGLSLHWDSYCPFSHSLLFSDTCRLCDKLLSTGSLLHGKILAQCHLPMIDFCLLLQPSPFWHVSPFLSVPFPHYLIPPMHMFPPPMSWTGQNI